MSVTAALSPVEPAEPFVHPALFYRGAAEYLAGTVPFVRAGLAAGEPVAVAVPGGNLALLRSALGADAVRVRLLDMMAAGRNPGRIIPGVLRAFADAHPGGPVRIIGEPVWPDRSGLEYPACAQHEALINHAFTGRDVTILCPYDVAGLDQDVLADAEATHPVLIDADGARDSEAYAPDRVVAAHNQPLPAPSVPVEEVVAATVPDVVAARRLASGHATRLGLSPDRAADVELAVTELLTNSVEHGGGAGTLRMWTCGDHLVCEVQDGGTLADPLAGRRPARRGHPRGRGLLLVNQIADLVRTHTGPGSTAIRAYFRMGPFTG
ncbi:anti-sigma factor RsbA family regulatory protein [Actinophytocola glycyrrhizae]|uniref:Anti-sigma factor RsbA family regulatory protein n=1 Tax=Actinophytocola glycyrrhizae TaxID=2044873 RepID=A0ABV9SA04_9PSEU